MWCVTQFMSFSSTVRVQEERAGNCSLAYRLLNHSRRNVISFLCPLQPRFRFAIIGNSLKTKNILNYIMLFSISFWGMLDDGGGTELLDWLIQWLILWDLGMNFIVHVNIVDSWFCTVIDMAFGNMRYICCYFIWIMFYQYLFVHTYKCIILYLIFLCVSFISMKIYKCECFSVYFSIHNIFIYRNSDAFYNIVLFVVRQQYLMNINNCLYAAVNIRSICICTQIMSLLHLFSLTAWGLLILMGLHIHIKMNIFPHHISMFQQPPMPIVIFLIQQP